MAKHKHHRKKHVQGAVGGMTGGLSNNRVSGKKPGQKKPTPGKILPPPKPDPALLAQQSANTLRRTTLLSDQDVDIQQASQGYGFGYNPATGQVGGFDPTNPFSQAALLMKARKERDQGENTSYAASGQLYSGAYQTAKTETGSAYDKGYDTLRRGFTDYVKNYLRRKRDIASVPIEELANL